MLGLNIMNLKTLIESWQSLPEETRAKLISKALEEDNLEKWRKMYEKVENTRITHRKFVKLISHPIRTYGIHYTKAYYQQFGKIPN